jgi:hypothetical protein
MSTTKSRRSPKRPVEDPVPPPEPAPEEPAELPPKGPEFAHPAELERLERVLLLHLLEHRGQQVRFEASQWTTEFGLLRRFSQEDPAGLRAALRSLEMTRMVYRRTQYVVGYSEPKQVYSLTATGHRKALEYRREDGSLADGGPLGDEHRSAPAVGGVGGPDRGSRPAPGA